MSIGPMMVKHVQSIGSSLIETRSVRITCGAMLIFLLAPGCGPDRESPGKQEAPTAASQRSSEGLRSRAEAYWAAKKAEDWNTLFAFLDPFDRQGATPEEYAKWSSEKEPFQVQSAAIAGVETSGDMGWVNVKYRTTLRRFPGLDPTDADHWQKWRFKDGQWFPVSARELGNYPAPPSTRDAAAEAQLRERFVETCQLRKDRNWEKLYELTDPRDHKRVSPSEFAESEGTFEYLECEVLWVEVLENVGEVRVRLRHKVSDPNMAKLPPRDAIATEPWIRLDGAWYRDLVKTTS